MSESVRSQTCAVCGEPLRAGQQQCPMCDTPVAPETAKPSAPVNASAALSASNLAATMPGEADAAPTTRAMTAEETAALMPEVSAVAAGIGEAERAETIAASRPRTPAEIARAEWTKQGEQKKVPPDATAGKPKPAVKSVARQLVTKKIAPQADRMRSASSQVMDDSAVDSGLRFVVVALLLIAFSVLIIFLSKVV